MKERTDGVVGVWSMEVTQRGQSLRICLYGLQVVHGDLNVDNRLCVQAWNCRGTVMVNAERQCSERLQKMLPLSLELLNPSWIVRHNLQFLRDVMRHIGRTAVSGQQTLSVIEVFQEWAGGTFVANRGASQHFALL